MSHLFEPAERQMTQITPYLPLAHGGPQADDPRVVSGIIYVIRNGLQWKDAPAGHGAHKTLYNRFIGWSLMGVFDRLFAGLSGEGPRPGRIMIDATHLKAHRTAESLLKRDVPRRIGPTGGGLNSRMYTVCDGDGRPVIMLLWEGRMRDHKGAGLVPDALPPAPHLIAGRGYDSAWFRAELEARGIEPCIPSSRSRKKPFNHDRVLYRQRHRIENLFAKLKEWRRIATRYDKLQTNFPAT